MRNTKKLFLATGLVFVLTVTQLFSQQMQRRSLSIDDIFTIKDLDDLQISPDGQWLAYTVSAYDTLKDKKLTHLHMSSWDGKQHLQLTFGMESENTPRWSPDNKYLAFLSARGVEGEASQVWLMNRAGGEAEKISDLKGGVNDFVWSPDSKRLALVVDDYDSTKEKSKVEEPPKPIVIDRFQFKEDVSGYLGSLRQHIYLLDLTTRKAEILTPGLYNEYLPSWSPDGSTIAFVSKRGDDFDRHNNYDIYLIDAKANATPRQLTTFDGADADPDWESRPDWRPDGQAIVYLQGGAKELFWYAFPKVAIQQIDGSPAKILTSEIDRECLHACWSPDGKTVYFLLEDNGNVHLGRVNATSRKNEVVIDGRHKIGGYALGRKGEIAVISSTPALPDEVFAYERAKLRRLSNFNDQLIAHLTLGSFDQVNFKSKDGTLIYGYLVKPPDFQAGKKYPTILWIHGGPVGQFANKFNPMWQLFAANGYVVIAANPRGSSGRGEAFSKAIFADWGNKDAQDVLASVDYVVSAGIADPDRLGIGGWSYGGMLTNYTIAQDTRFKAAISGAGISNILAGYGTDRYIREYELELGVPWKNPDAWIRISFPFLHADRIITPTLFLCGEKDFNVPLINSEQMYQALKSLGIETQLIIYPNQFHGLTRTSYQRDRFERYLLWYDKFLKTPNVKVE